MSILTGNNPFQTSLEETTKTNSSYIEEHKKSIQHHLKEADHYEERAYLRSSDEYKKIAAQKTIENYYCPW